MIQRGRRAKTKRRNEIIFGSLIILFVMTSLAGIAYLMLTREEGLDRTTLCPAKGPKGHYVLLVDKTDPLTFLQKEAFEVTLKELVERKIPEGYLLSVFALGEDFKENAKPLIELCNPGRGDNKSAITNNPKKLERQYQENFLKPFLKQSEQLLGKQSAETSPIFEMLQLVSINAFRTHDIKGERRLILMSDMLHNTPQFSMYKEKTLTDYAVFTTSDYGRKTQLNLHEVEIELHYLMNSPQFQTKRNLKFWEDYFNKAGARIVIVNVLEG